jgi:hypothetical protein
VKRALAVAALAWVALAGCGERGDSVRDGVRQTRLPGMVSAGGHTSGEVMAAALSPSTASQRGPAGTPGIPRGAEGNTGGTAMGGTTASAPSAGAEAPTGPASAAGAAASAALAPASAASAPAMSDAQRQQLELSAAQDAVAARWRARALAQGLPTHPPTPVDPVRGIQASATPAAAPAATPAIRSEKLGTAPASPDVKQATKPVTDDDVNSRHPKAAGKNP